MFSIPRPTTLRPLAGVIDDIEREDDARGYEDAARVALPELHSMRTADLTALRAGSAYECLLPTLPDATEVVRDLLCASCPLTALCGEINRRTAQTAVVDAAPAPLPAVAVVDELTTRRTIPRGVRSALIWRAA